MTSVKSKPKIVLKAIILLVIAVSLAGCSGGMGSSGGATTTPPAGGTAALSPAASFYVINQNYLPSTILQFSRTANGSVAPTSTIAGPAEAGFISLTVDALHTSPDQPSTVAWSPCGPGGAGRKAGAWSVL